MRTVRINVLFGGRAMKEDIEKIFGSELRYLKKLSVGQLASLVWFGMSFFLRHCLPT